MLNEARKHVPTSIEIWITAAKLEETHKKYEMVLLVMWSYHQPVQVERIISRGVDNLTAKGAGRDRDAWMKHAEEVEKTNYPHTCEAIIKVGGY